MAQRLHVFTARFEPELYEELRAVTEMNRSSINQFVTAAVKSRLRQTRSSLKRRYEIALEKLERYAEQDPGFEQAIEEFAAAEAKIEDPAEGEIYFEVEDESEQELMNILSGSA